MATPIFDQSIFKFYFESNDAELIAWSNNVLRKLRERGIVASFIERELDFDSSDADFDAVYKPATLFFGYLVLLARNYERFKTNDFLVNEYLLNKGHYTTGDESLDVLLNIVTNLLRRRAARGSIDTITPGNIGQDIPNGEILSLLGWNEDVFFKLGLGRPQKNSWNVDNCCSLHRGCTGRYDLNVGYENTEDVVDLLAYPLLNATYIKKTEFRYKNCIEIEDAPLQESGIGATDLNKRIVINPNQNFEITFYVAQDVTLENLTFGVKCFDIDGNQIYTKSIVDGSDRNYFFETRRLNKAGKFYFIRGIIFNKDEDLRSATDGKLNIGFGENLKFPEDAVSIIPYIVMDNNHGNDSEFTSDYFDDASSDYFTGADSDSVSAPSDYYDGSASIYLWNIKVTPCSLGYGRGYVGNKNFIDAIVSNRNGRFSEEQINDILRKYFIPYNTPFKVTYLEDDGSISLLGYLLWEDGSYVLSEDDELISLE
jgi:hypothetical protein